MKHKRQIDDAMRIGALVICSAPVLTFCGIFSVYTVKSIAFGQTVDLNVVTSAFKEIVFIIIGGASGFAWGRLAAQNASIRESIEPSAAVSAQEKEQTNE
jgi:hypothetical protein